MKHHTPQQKQTILQEYINGGSPSEIALRHGIHRNTLLSWAKKAGIKPKEVAAARTHDGEVLTFDKKATTLSELRAMRKQAEIVSAESVAKAASTPADAYNAYMAETVMTAIQQSAEAMPRVKSWADFERANKIMRQALGLDVGNSKSGIGGRISLDVNIINGQIKRPTIDAQIVGEKTCEVASMGDYAVEDVTDNPQDLPD